MTEHRVRHLEEENGSTASKCKNECGADNQQKVKSRTNDEKNATTDAPKILFMKRMKSYLTNPQICFSTHTSREDETQTLSQYRNAIPEGFIPRDPFLSADWLRGMFCAGSGIEMYQLYF